MLKIKKGDTVQVIRGDDKGKRGKVLKVMATANRAIVEGINLVKKHKRKTQQDQQGGIVAIESAMSSGNLMYFCKQCSKPTRVGFILSKEGTKSRYCKNCKETI